MPKYEWPISMLEDCNVPVSTLVFLDSFAKESNQRSEEFIKLYEEHEFLKATAAKQERYIAELEKQLGLLQKTLDLIDARGDGNG